MLSTLPAKKRHPRRIEPWPVADLKPHESQAALFNDLDDDGLQALADDMEANRLNHPVEILPDGTIICGHQRVRAAKLLGWKEIRCWIREDLLKKGEQAVEAHLIEDNLNRRQLDMVAKARAAKRLVELEYARRGTRLSWEDADARDRVGRRIGMSGRNLQRYLNVLDAPIEIQHALSSGELKLIAADRVSRLPKQQQRRMAARIATGEAAKDVVAEVLGMEPEAKSNAQLEAESLIQSLKRAQELIGCVDDLPAGFLASNRPVLEDGVALLQTLLGRSRERVRKPA